MPSGPYECTKDTCPASESIIGYAPDKAANIAFLVIFFLSGVIHAFQGFRYKTWSFGICMCIGGLCEGGGYVGRFILSDDPFNDPGFKLQAVMLTFAPAFYAAGIYFMLKHLILTFGTRMSRLRPSWYTYIFIACDLLSISLQGTGGGLASGAGSTLEAGNNVMLAGLSFQVATMVVFGILAAEYFLRIRRNPNAINPETSELRASLRFRGFVIALIIAYFTILVRCIYRVVELSDGWGSAIMRDEVAFNVLDPIMCIIATCVLNAFHPGVCFEGRVANPPPEKKTVSDSSSDSEGNIGVQSSM